MHASLVALRTSMSNCAELLAELGIAPASVDAARAQLDGVALNAEIAERDDGDTVH